MPLPTAEVVNAESMSKFNKAESMSNFDSNKCVTTVVIVSVVILALIGIGYIIYHCVCKYRKKRNKKTQNIIVLREGDNIEPIVCTKENFGDYQHGTYVLLLLAAWCHHCKQFKERTDNFLGFVQKHPGKLLVLDPFEAGMDGLVEQANIRGFPAICIMKDGVITEHHVPQTIDAVIELYEKKR